MDIGFWLGLIGSVTGIASLLLYGFEIYRYKSKITVKLRNYSVQFFGMNKQYGEITLIPVDSMENAIELLEEGFYSLEVRMNFLISNKGNKRATLDRVYFNYSKSHNQSIDLLNKNIISVDIGESYKSGVTYYTQDKDEVIKILNEKCEIIFFDNKDKKYKLKIGNLDLKNTEIQ